MAVDLANYVSAAIPTPTSSSTSSSSSSYSNTNPDVVRKTEEARMAQLAEQRRLEEIQADEKRAETAREERNRREEVSRNANGELVGTTFSVTA